MALLARNNATSTLSATLTNVATSLSVQSGHGVRFPNPTGGDYFYVAIIGVGKYEVVKVTARSTDSMTIVRAQDNTTADSFSSGDAVKLLVTAVYITDTWTELGLKATINSPTFTGTPAAPTAAVDTNTTQVATTAYVVGQGYAKLASPTFTGTPAAPTAAVDTNTTQVATTAYVVGQGYLKSATAASTYQPVDADLTSIAGLGYASTSFLKKTAANTWALDTATYEPSYAAGTTAQYYRGDKSWQTLNAAAVGLGNVTNESKATMFQDPTFTGTVSYGNTAVVTNWNADRVDSYHADTAATNSTVAVRDGTGIIHAASFDMSAAASNYTADHYCYEAFSDGLIRKKTLANTQAEIVTPTAVAAAIGTNGGIVTKTAVLANGATTTFTGSGDVACGMLILRDTNAGGVALVLVDPGIAGVSVVSDPSTITGGGKWGVSTSGNNVVLTNNWGSSRTHKSMYLSTSGAVS